MSVPTLLTLPQLAEAVGVQYRTLHSWIKRGLLAPSVQKSRGTGVPNLFSRQDAVKAKVIADLRQTGLSFERLVEAAIRLDANEVATTTGAMVLVNGAVSIVDAEAAVIAIERESMTLIYNTRYAIEAVDASLPAAE